MDKTSTPVLTPTRPRAAHVVMQPRRSTIEKLRQFARAAFPTPLGTPVIIN